MYRVNVCHFSLCWHLYARVDLHWTMQTFDWLMLDIECLFRFLLNSTHPSLPVIRKQSPSSITFAESNGIARFPHNELQSNHMHCIFQEQNRKSSRRTTTEIFNLNQSLRSWN